MTTSNAIEARKWVGHLIKNRVEKTSSEFLSVYFKADDLPGALGISEANWVSLLEVVPWNSAKALMTGAWPHSFESTRVLGANKVKQTVHFFRFNNCVDYSSSYPRKASPNVDYADTTGVYLTRHTPQHTARMPVGIVAVGGDDDSEESEPHPSLEEDWEPSEAELETVGDDSKGAEEAVSLRDHGDKASPADSSPVKRPTNERRSSYPSHFPRSHQ